LLIVLFNSTNKTDKISKKLHESKKSRFNALTTALTKAVIQFIIMSDQKYLSTCEKRKRSRKDDDATHMTGPRQRRKTAPPPIEIRSARKQHVSDFLKCAPRVKFHLFCDHYNITPSQLKEYLKGKKTQYDDKIETDIHSLKLNPDLKKELSNQTDLIVCDPISRGVVEHATTAYTPSLSSDRENIAATIQSCQTDIQNNEILLQALIARMPRFN
jgi:hypothetical protein